MHDPANEFSDAECADLMLALFPNGWASDDVLSEIAPGGYENSPLAAAFHPTVEQVYREAVAQHRHMRGLFNDRSPPEPRPEPTVEDIARDFHPAPIEPARELGELVGLCLWDIFSDEHEVIDPTGRVAHLGSFRGSGDFLAGLLNRQIGEERYDYLDFYLGTVGFNRRVELAPVYAMIFRRLHSQGFDWVYHFPRLYAVDFRPLKKALDEAQQPEWTNYDPSEALAKEAEEEERDRQLAEFRESLDEGYRESVEAAREGPPPATVRGYHAVYGRFPRGWPPWERDG